MWRSVFYFKQMSKFRIKACLFVTITNLLFFWFWSIPTMESNQIFTFLPENLGTWTESHSLVRQSTPSHTSLFFLWWLHIKQKCSASTENRLGSSCNEDYVFFLDWTKDSVSWQISWTGQKLKLSLLSLLNVGQLVPLTQLNLEKNRRAWNSFWASFRQVCLRYNLRDRTVA